ncbi:MAG: hypothetical protein V2I43_09575 [Parvularcula sp.]|nr:hypothetical protein [Parvularcula sp.]
MIATEETAWITLRGSRGEILNLAADTVVEVQDSINRLLELAVGTPIRVESREAVVLRNPYQTAEPQGFSAEG